MQGRMFRKGEQNMQYPVNCIRLCIDSYSQETCSGRISGVALEEEIPFHDAPDFIVQVDEAFNRIGKPQSGQVLRGFEKNCRHYPYIGEPKRHTESSRIASKRGEEKTFDLLMVSRKCAEWQGKLFNIEGTLIGKFESVLECMALIAQA